MMTEDEVEEQVRSLYMELLAVLEGRLLHPVVIVNATLRLTIAVALTGEIGLENFLAGVKDAWETAEANGADHLGKPS